jgi:replication factor C large subunit
MKPWTKKHEPKTPSQVIGQDLAVHQIRNKLSTKKPLLLYGPTGTGKTAAVYALSKELGFEVFEMNSSDQRNKKGILETLQTTIVQQSLFSKKRVILIDDIDALSGRRDRGGLTTIISLFAKTKHPIILTCTDPWSDKLSKLRRKCVLIEFKHIKKDKILDKLKEICEKEEIIYKEEDIVSLAKKATGDLRAAINDLQTNCINKQLITSLDEERQKREDIHFCLRKILKGRKMEEVHNIFFKVDMDTSTCMLWLDENLPKEYSGGSLKKAYNYLSRADVFYGRIRRWQHWRFLVYINTLITSGIAFSKTETNINFTEYKRTSRILKMWMAKQRYAKKNAICEKIAHKTHTSKKDAIKNSFPYLKKILLQPKIIAELDLSEDEIAWLQK